GGTNTEISIMTRLLRYALPVVAALALVMGISALTARAQESKDSKDAKTGKGKIAGTVTDKDGKAVEGVEVRLIKPRQRGGGGGGASPTTRSALGGGGQAVPLQAQRPTPIATAKTDKDGKFTMDDVAVGDYMVGVRDDDKKVYGRARVTVEEGKTATVEVKCSDTPPARGGGGGGGGRPPAGGGGGGNQ